MTKTHCLLALALLSASLTSVSAAEPAPAATPAFNSRTTRLFEIGVHRYVRGPNGTTIEQRYLLNALNQLTLADTANVPTGVVIPDEAIGVTLIPSSAWLAYLRLGPVAFANFKLVTEVPIDIATRLQFEVGVSDDAKTNAGQLINISTRGRVTPQEKLVAGFVVTEQHRRVLVRAVGPTLQQFGVADVLADPTLTIFAGTTAVSTNDNWSARPDAADTAAAAQRVGAFPLPAGSKDAALVVELPPGAYTVHVEPSTGAPGVALVEVYTLP
jgi:hypothetical protein